MTVGSPGRASLHGRAGGLSNLIWDGLAKAGWVSQTAKLHPLIRLVIDVPPCRAQEHAAARSPVALLRPGGPRRKGEGGRVLDDGTVRMAYEGPLHARAAGPGFQLLDSERRAEDFDSFEDMLYQAAVQAGWLTADRERPSAVEIPAIEIVVRIPRHGSDN